VRKLNPDESDVWSRVAKTVRPLKAQDKTKGRQGDEPPPVLLDPIHSPRPASSRDLSLGDSLDGGWDRRLKAGSVEPDRTLDLHGMTLDAAWTAIDRLLESAWNRGDRLVLLVTGRERDPASGRGRIRGAVRNWLEASRHGPHIAAIRSAHRKHGGEGSLYIILRRH